MYNKPVIPNLFYSAHTFVAQGRNSHLNYFALIKKFT